MSSSTSMNLSHHQAESSVGRPKPTPKQTAAPRRCALGAA